jgi:hypothetical protein
VDEIAPEVMILAGVAAGSNTELPPVIDKLPDAIDNVGCGTLTL